MYMYISFIYIYIYICAYICVYMYIYIYVSLHLYNISNRRVRTACKVRLFNSACMSTLAFQFPNECGCDDVI